MLVFLNNTIWWLLLRIWSYPYFKIDDAKIAEEMRGFVVEEGEEDEDMPNRKKHKKKHRHEHTEDATAEGEPSEPREKHTKEHDSADEDLEDEDFDLLRENLGYEVRPVCAHFKHDVIIRLYYHIYLLLLAEKQSYPGKL